MAHKQNNKTARIDLDITVESQQRFAAIHKALGFKTRTETFEAIVFSWDCFKITKDRETRHDRSRVVSLG